MFSFLQRRSLSTSHRFRQKKYPFPHVRRSPDRRRIERRNPLLFALVVFASAVCVIAAANWEVDNLKTVKRDAVQKVKSDSGTEGAFSYKGKNLELQFSKGSHTFGVVSRDPSRVTFKYTGPCKFGFGVKDHVVQFETNAIKDEIHFAELKDNWVSGTPTVKFTKDEMSMGKIHKIPANNGDAMEFNSLPMRLYRLEVPDVCDVIAVFDDADLVVPKEPTTTEESTDWLVPVFVGLAIGIVLLCVIIAIAWVVRHRSAQKAEKNNENKKTKPNENKEAKKNVAAKKPEAHPISDQKVEDKKGTTRLALDTMGKTTMGKTMKTNPDEPTLTKEKMPPKSAREAPTAPIVADSSPPRYDYIAPRRIPRTERRPSPPREIRVERRETDTELVYEKDLPAWFRKMVQKKKKGGENSTKTAKTPTPEEEAAVGPKAEGPAGKSRKSSTRTAEPLEKTAKSKTNTTENSVEGSRVLNWCRGRLQRLNPWGKSTTTESVDSTQEDAPAEPPVAEGQPTNKPKKAASK